MQQKNYAGECRSEKANRFPSEAAERFQIRLPEGMRERIRRSADAGGRSMNTEIVRRLGDSLGEMSIEFHADAGQKQDGSAEAATSPSHGSRIPKQEKTVNGHEDTTAPPQAASRRSPEKCSVMALVERLSSVRFQALSTEEEALTASHSGRLVEEDIFWSVHSHALHVETALRDLISATEAWSLAGAAVQVMEAVRHVEMLDPDVSVFEGKQDFQSGKAALFRILYSILAVLKHHSGSDLDGVLDDMFWAENIDPWDTPVDRIQATRADEMERGA